MAEYSIIEFIVYGLVGYTGVVLMVASAFREVPATKSLAVVRSIWLLPSIYCLIMLAGISGTIYLDEGVETTSTLINVNTTETWTETVNVTPNSIVLVEPIWGTVHIIFYMMLILYFIWNMLQLLVKRD